MDVGLHGREDPEMDTIHEPAGRAIRITACPELCFVFQEIHSTALKPQMSWCCLLQRLPLPRQEASSVLDLYSQHATYDTWVQTEPPGPGEVRGDSADTAAREAGPWSSAGSQQNC